MGQILLIGNVVIFVTLSAIVQLSSGNNFTEEVIQYCNSTLNDVPQRGICINFDHKLRNCLPLLNLLKQKKFTELHGTFCHAPGPALEVSWACCPEGSLLDTFGDNFEKHPNFKLLPTPESSACGQGANSDRIIGGQDATPGEFPWLARISTFQSDDDEEEFTCGGSIISSRYILSAAHCFREKGVKVTKIRVGDTHGDAVTECVEFGASSICEKEEDYEVEEVIVHPEYAGNTGSQHDIALLRLNRNIRNMTSLFVRPICLPFTKEFQITPIQIPHGGTEGLHFVQPIVAGWGKLFNSDNEGSPDLQFLSVPLVDHEFCSNVFSPNKVTITEDQLCAGGEKEKGSCAGDSGGPLFYPAKSKGKSTIRNYQIGVVSYGKSQCATANAPVVYTRVRRYLNWILDTIKE